MSSSTSGAVLELDQPILDVDAHEMFPAHLWGEAFGPAAGRIASLSTAMFEVSGENDYGNTAIDSDVMEISFDSVWNTKGVAAPGAFDLARRLQVMDEMGIERQLVFPSFAAFANHFVLAEMYMLQDRYRLTIPEPEARELGRAGLREYNEWVVKASAFAPDRIRPVAYVAAGETVEDLIERTTDLLDRGVRVINMPTAIPPGGHSPAHESLDPFWALLAEREAVFTVHVGDITGFSATPEWRRAAYFAPGKRQSAELGSEPYTFSTVHFAVENYLICMVMGGVFERHPNLRVGAIELGSTWLGPMADRLDMFAAKAFSKWTKQHLSRRPSEYLASNVRVTPFNGIEPVADMLRAHSNVVDCYCFSTDYPHTEGGRYALTQQLEAVAPLGKETLNKFFSENGRLLFPD